MDIIDIEIESDIDKPIIILMDDEMN